MAKMYGFSGKVTGKKGDAVFAVRKGEQIIRQYNPIVANPNTMPQVNSRARLKLMSQLAAAYALVIAMPSVGSKTKRNMFSKVNYGLTSAVDGTAIVDLNTIQLTKSSNPMVSFTANRSSGNAIAVALDESAEGIFDRVVYVCMAKNSDGSIRLHDSIVVNQMGADGLFAGQLAYTGKSIVCYAYGISDLNSKATAKFGNMNCNTAEDVARLISNRAVSAADARVSETTGLTIESGNQTGSSADSNRVAVQVISAGHCTVNGSGFYAIGDVATASCSPDENYVFVGWYADQACTQLLSSNAIYQFTVNAATSVYAKCLATIGPSNTYLITASSNNNSLGTVTGGGQVEAGQSVTLTATPAAGATFGGWYVNGVKVSDNATYTYTPDKNETVTAQFVAAGGSQMHIVATSNNTGNGTVSGDGYYNVGGTCTLVATPAAGAEFEGWYENGTKVSSSLTYSFEVTTDRVLTAQFAGYGDTN